MDYTVSVLLLYSKQDRMVNPPINKLGKETKMKYSVKRDLEEKARGRSYTVEHTGIR